MTPEAVEVILEYIYRGSWSDLSRNALDVMAAADRLVVYLFTRCLPTCFSFIVSFSLSKKSDTFGSWNFSVARF